MPPTTPPSPNRSASLPYLEIDERPFEDLCCALLAEQPGFDPQDVELFERKGLKQFGIDVLARRKDRSWVGLSCKRYERMPPADLRQWCDDFLDHWSEKWSSYPVALFILAVTVRPKSEAQRKEIAKQQERFARLGCDFQIWHTTVLDRLLRDQPDLVRRHFTPHWAEFHCGVTETPAAGLRSDARLTSFDRNVSDDLRRLVEARDQGRTRDVADLLDRLGRVVEYARLDERDKRTYRRVAVSEALEGFGYRAAEDVIIRFPGPIGGDLEALIALDRDGEVAALTVLDASGERHDGIRAQILLAKGDPDGALRLLDDPLDPVDIAIRAKALAAKGRVAEAIEAQRIAERDAESAAVARAGLAVRFACATAPSLGTCVTSPWPEPLPDELLRRDDEALALLREGADIALARSGTPGTASAERQGWLTWHVAFLCCDETSRPRAGALVRQCVDRGEATPGMVLWALWSDLDIDRRRAVVEMERAVRLNSAEPEHLFALLYLLEAEGKVDDARRALRAASHRFAHFRGFTQARDLWMRRLDADMSADSFAEALDGAVRHGRWDALLTVVGREGEAVGETARRLVLAARTLARFGRWADLATLCGRLAAEIGTADAVELAARGWAGVGEWGRVVSLLSDTAPFSNGRLPVGAALVLAEARARTGDLSGSLAIRRELHGTPADPQGVTLARSLLAVGDIGGAAYITATVDLSRLPPDEVAAAIAITRVANPLRARSLAERVLDLPSIPDELLPHLLEHGYALGLDNRVGSLLADAVASSRIEGRSMSLDEVVEHMTERQRAAEELNEAHRKGELPMALFGRAVNLDTAELVLGGRHVGANPIVLAQHGSRRARDIDRLPCDPPIPERPRRLALDLPALLLAHRFGFLSDLRGAFGTLCLPQGLPLALAESIPRAAPYQASVSEARARVGEALRRGRIRVSDGQVDLRVGDPESGADETFEQFLSGLAAEGGVGGGRGPDRRRSVALGPGRLRQLAASDRWDSVLDRFDIVASTRDRDELHGELRAEGFDAARRELLLRLVEDVSDGLASGRYETMEQRPGPHEDREPPNSADEAILEALFLSGFPDGCVLFSGDRCINGFVSLDATPVVGVSIVLNWMEEAGSVTAARRRDLLASMRDANVHFIPLDAHEIECALLRAPIEGGSLVETDELRSLRRHVATETLMQDSWRLDGTTGIDGQLVEFGIVHDAQKALLNCVRDLWLRTEGEDGRAARADYVVECLLTDRLDRIPLAGGDGGKEAWAAMIVGRLYAAAFEVGLHDLDRAAHLVAWVESRLAGPRARDASGFNDRVGSMLAPLLDIMMSEGDFPESTQAAVLGAFRGRMRQVLELLPDTVVDAVHERRAGGAGRQRREERIVVGDCSILPAVFDEAVRLAAVDGAAEIGLQAPSGRGVGVLGRADARRGNFELVFQGTRYPMDDLRLALVSRSGLGLPSLDSRAGLGTLEAAWIDEAWSRGCSGIGDADALIEGAYALRLTHAERCLDAGSFVRQALHPPSPAALDRHLDVATGSRGTVAEWFSSQTDGTVADLSSGSGRRLLRLLHLPLDFGTGPRDAIRAMGAGERAEIIESLAATCGSAVARSHLRRWFGGDAEAEDRHALPSLPECGALRVLFRWTWRITERSPSWRTLEMPWRLLYCWYHASRLSALLATKGVDPHAVVRRIETWDADGVEPALLPRHDTRREVAGPEIGAEAIYLALFLHGCAEEPDARQLGDLDHVILTREGGRAYPHPSVVEAPTMPDAIGSLFSTARGIPPSWLTDLSAWLDPLAVEAALERDPPWASEAADRGRAWAEFLLLRRRHLPVAEANSLVDSWTRLDVKRRMAGDRDWLTALTLLCAMRHELGAGHQEWLGELLNEMAAMPMEGVRDEQRLELALRYLVQPADGRRGAAMAGDVLRIDACLRRNAKDSTAALVRLAREVGPVASSELWRRITSLRAA